MKAFYQQKEGMSNLYSLPILYGCIDSLANLCYNKPNDSICQKGGSMPYEYLDHEADIGLRSIGDTLEEALAEGARAMLHIMVNQETVTPVTQIPVGCQAGDLESLFVTLLNELLYLREVKTATLVDFQVMRLEQSDEGWVLEGLATGEPLDPDKHEFMTEVKAATYFGLKHYTKGNQHVFQCVVDV